MDSLKQKILNDGCIVGNDIIKVDSFLNHQLDVEFLNLIGQEFYRRFRNQPISRILTCEASGIAIATITAQYFKVPVVFAKKSPSKNLDPHTYSAQVYSYTRQSNYEMQVNKGYLLAEDQVLIIDDFLANGQAVLGMAELVRQAGATLVGVGVVVEKGFQPGGAKLQEAGIHLESLAVIDQIENGQIVFRD